MKNSLEFVQCIDYKKGVELYQDKATGRLFKRTVTNILDIDGEIRTAKTTFCELVDGPELFDPLAKVLTRDN